MSTYYLHVKSRQPMAGSDKHVHFFVRNLSKPSYDDLKQFIVPHLQHEAKDTADARRYASARRLEGEPQPEHPEYEKEHAMGTYAIFQHKCKYRLLTPQRGEGPSANKYILCHDLAKKIQHSAYEWRQREVRLLNQYQPLIIYPNNHEYWRELIRRVLAHPNKYPKLVGVDKVLFALCWHKVPLFYATYRKEGGGGWEASGMISRDPCMTRLTALPLNPVPPDPRILYTKAHFHALWVDTFHAALDGEQP